MKINGEKRLVLVTIFRNKRKIKIIDDRRLKTQKHWKFEKIKDIQDKRNEWSHLSFEYPNIMGLTDEEINKFLKEQKEFIFSLQIPESSKNDQFNAIKDYIAHMKCYDKEEIKRLSEKMYSDFYIKMEAQDKSFPEHNKFQKNRTIFLSSPRGGLEILSDFAYANDLSKAMLPYDLEAIPDKPSEPVKPDDLNRNTNLMVKSSSLPYSNVIFDVNDIVFIDDICMSGEQQSSALHSICKQLEDMHVDKRQFPRIHYMSIVKNKEASDSPEEYTNPLVDRHWHSITYGEEFYFRKTPSTESNYISAVVFPYSLPDGEHHRIARELYSHEKNRFKHRKYG